MRKIEGQMVTAELRVAKEFDLMKVKASKKGRERIARLARSIGDARQSVPSRRPH